MSDANAHPACNCKALGWFLVYKELFCSHSSPWVIAFSFCFHPSQDLCTWLSSKGFPGPSSRAVPIFVTAAPALLLLVPAGPGCPKWPGMSQCVWSVTGHPLPTLPCFSPTQQWGLTADPPPTEEKSPDRESLASPHWSPGCCLGSALDIPHPSALLLAFSHLGTCYLWSAAPASPALALAGLVPTPKARLLQHLRDLQSGKAGDWRVLQPLLRTRVVCVEPEHWGRPQLLEGNVLTLAQLDRHNHLCSSTPAPS